MTVLAFVAFTAAAVLGPGVALQRLLRLRPTLALVIPLGLLMASSAYGLALLTSAPMLFPLVVIGLDCTLLFRSPDGRGMGIGDLHLAILPFLALLGILAVTEYPLNRRDAGGDFLIDPVLPEDTAFHAGLTWELSHSYPPEVPGFSGRAMTYHIGSPLVRAAALRFARVLPYDSLTRFDNTLGALALVLLLPEVVRALGGTPRAAALAPWFLLATDFSFLLAWGRRIPFWITATKGSDFLFSILQSNATVPALLLALGAIVALDYHEREKRAGWLVVAVVLALGTAFFKVFVAAQLLIGLSAALLLAREKKRVLWLLGPLLLAVGALVLGPGGRGERVLLDPLVVLKDVRQALSLGPATEVPPVVFVVLWVVASLGLRIFGLRDALRSLWSKEAAAVILGGMALSGWPLGMLLRISPIESPDKPQNEALYFFEQSGVLLWPFVAIGLGRLRLSGRAFGVLVGATALVTLPSTVQLVLHKAALPPGRVPGEVWNAMQPLADVTMPGDVLIERPRMQRFPPPPMVFIGRRVPFTSYLPFLSQWVPKADLEVRLSLVQEFFRTEDGARAEEIARTLGARGVCLYGSDAVAFDTSGLRPVVVGRLVRIYLFPDYLTKR